MPNIPTSEAIRKMVKTAVESFAEGFKARHEAEVDNPEGILNMKIHNVFIAALGPDIQYYSALMRSLDSSLGNMLEKLAIGIAELFYEVHRNVEGTITREQTQKIAELLEKYKRNKKIPEIDDYQFLRKKPASKSRSVVRHDSDYYLIDKETKTHSLIELKIGGDLDNKKARSEKEAILEQFAILSNNLPKNANIEIKFATAYNRYGEDKPWQQGRVLQFFSKDELLIGKDFWNFVSKSPNGYDIVLDEYRKNAHQIMNALEEIKRLYLR